MGFAGFGGITLNDFRTKKPEVFARLATDMKEKRKKRAGETGGLGCGGHAGLPGGQDAQWVARSDSRNEMKKMKDCSKTCQSPGKN
jgi:hypothetical protein